MAKIFDDFKDVILALKNTERCKDPEYKKLWGEKSKDVKKRLLELSEEESNQFELKFKDWIKDHK